MKLVNREYRFMTICNPQSDPAQAQHCKTLVMSLRTQISAAMVIVRTRRDIPRITRERLERSMIRARQMIARCIGDGYRMAPHVMGDLAMYQPSIEMDLRSVQRAVAALDTGALSETRAAIPAHIIAADNLAQRVGISIPQAMARMKRRAA